MWHGSLPWREEVARLPSSRDAIGLQVLSTAASAADGLLWDHPSQALSAPYSREGLASPACKGICSRTARRACQVAAASTGRRHTPIGLLACRNEGRRSKPAKSAAGAIAEAASKGAKLRCGTWQSPSTQLRLHWLLLRIEVLMRVQLLLLLRQRLLRGIECSQSSIAATIKGIVIC